MNLNIVLEVGQVFVSWLGLAFHNKERSLSKLTVQTFGSNHNLSST